MLCLNFAGDTELYSSDQTPTPTRFLRSCEESGLFQELEEANPFDQDFKSINDGSSKPSEPAEKSEFLISKCYFNFNSIASDTEISRDETSTKGASTAIPVAPPANLVNPDKPVAMATAPAHISTASASTKQKLLQNIQMKEQQKLLEQTIAQQLGQSPEILAQALKNMIPVKLMSN